MESLVVPLIGAGSFKVIMEGLDLDFKSLVALSAWSGLDLDVQTLCKLFKTSPTFTNLCTSLRCLHILSFLGVW